MVKIKPHFNVIFYLLRKGENDWSSAQRGHAEFNNMERVFKCAAHLSLCEEFEKVKARVEEETEEFIFKKGISERKTTSPRTLFD